MVISMSNIKWLLKFSKESKKDFYMYCIIALLIVIIWLIIPLLVTKYTLLLTENSLKSLYHIGFIIFGIHFLYSFLKYFISSLRRCMMFLIIFILFPNSTQTYHNPFLFNFMTFF